MKTLINKKLIMILFALLLSNFSVVYPQLIVTSENIKDNEYKLNIKDQTSFLELQEHYLLDLHLTQVPYFYRDLFLSIPDSKIRNIQISKRNYTKISGLINEKLFNAIINSSDQYQTEVINLGSFHVKEENILHIKIRGISRDLQNYLNEFELLIEFEQKFNTFEETKIVTKSEFKQNKISFKNYSKKTAKLTNGLSNVPSGFIKIGVANDGIFRINYSDLINQKINPISIDPLNFKLLLRGEEIPIFVSGENDNSFDVTDYIEFYGEKNYGKKHREIGRFDEQYNEYLNRYSDTTIFFLTWEEGQGKRVLSNYNDTETTNDTINYYYKIDRFESNGWYDFSIANVVRREFPYWNENKTWHEQQLVGGSSRSKTFNLSNIVPNKSTFIFAKLLDFASNVTQKSHLLGLSVNDNGNIYDSTYLDKYGKVVLSAEIPSTALVEGSNKLSIHSFNTEATLNSCLVDWYEIEYPKILKYDKGNILIDASKYPIGASVFKISDISQEEIFVWNLGDEVKRYVFDNIKNTLSFGDTVFSSTKFFITDTTALLKPKLYGYFKNPQLSNSQDQAEYLIITNSKFFEKANEYATFIASNYNTSTKVIDIDDIYNEYSFGFFEPEAIKDFLVSIRENWQSAKPKYLFLVGSATFDYYGNKHKYFGIPRKINIVPSYGSPVSDNWYALFDSLNTFVPEINIGRIPVSEIEQFEWYFQKHKEHLETGYTEWNKKFIFFSGGNGDNKVEMDLLKDVNTFIIDNYSKPPPVSGLVNHFYKTVNPPTNYGPISATQFEKTIDEGGIFISYLGHSGTRTWDNGITEVNQISNKVNKYPLITDFGCSTVRFAEPDVTSFSELFTLDKNGQALVYIGNSSLGFLSTATSFPKLFYKSLLKDSILTISESLNNAKLDLIKNYGSSDLNKLFILSNTLIGDPIIAIKLPGKPNLLISDVDIEIDVNENNDSTVVGINYKNYGNSLSDSVTISIIHTFNNNVEYLNFRKPIPQLEDSLKIKIFTKDKLGVHNITVKLDADENLDEIYENDNEAKTQFTIFSKSIRALLPTSNENALLNHLTLINPSFNLQNSGFTFEFDSSSSFTNSYKSEQNFDTLFTKINIPEYYKKRIFFRTKLHNELSPGNAITFYHGSSNYLLKDSASYSQSEFNKVKYNNQMLNLLHNNIELNVTSSGYNDGNIVFITKNGSNYAPDGYLRGHHVVLLDTLDCSFIDYKYFDLLNNDELVLNSYIEYLDTLTNKYFVLIGIADEGSTSNSELIAQFISIGSVHFGKQGWRGSWGIIGQKGAVPGSVPESFSKTGTGNVKVDTSFSKIFNEGNFLSSNIGPSTNWKNINVSDTLANNSSIKYYPILIGENNIPIDTLDALNILNGKASLSHINAKDYPYIKILAEFEAGDNNTSPELYSLGVDYIGVPELAINYQVVSVEKDTIQQGEDANLSFYVYNVGESAADSFKVKVEVVKPDNSREIILEEIIDSLGSEKRRKFNLSYPTTNFNGLRTFAISIDSDDKVTELYEDNNYYNIPFHVIGDTTKPSMNLTIDGNDIFDGEYIAANPEIKIELSDPSLIPITDTSSISIFLNNKYISYKGHEELLAINYSATNPKATVNYKPTLEDGEYTLRVFGKDASGNIGDSSGITKNFNVESNAKLLNVYNYPNPFVDDTYFTFKLTQIPDEIKIKVFTIAGRLIKEIVLNNGQLNFDLNKIHWDGRDEDGDQVGNGVYLYKVIMDVDGKKQDVTQKLAVVR